MDEPLCGIMRQRVEDGDEGASGTAKDLPSVSTPDSRSVLPEVRCKLTVILAVEDLTITYLSEPNSRSSAIFGNEF